MMETQLKKYKTAIASKQQKLAAIEADLADRFKSFEQKQTAFESQVMGRHHTEKETLIRLRNQVKASKAQHKALKKEILVEAQVV